MPRNIVLTGGSGGLGAALVAAFNPPGDRVWNLSRRLAAPSSAPGRRSTEVDVTDSVALAAAAQSILDEWGHVDVLVNNAGTVSFNDFRDTTETQLVQQVEVNLLAPFRLTRSLLPGLERARGCVINISSSSAVRPVSGRPAAAYAMTKGGLEALTRALAQELGPSGVRVNAVAPGTLETPMTEAVLRAAAPGAVEARFPMRRVGRPADVVGAVRYLASPDAAWVTGAVIRVDGGFTVA